MLAGEQFLRANHALGLESQRRTAAAQDAGYYDDEIVPMDTKMIKVDKETKESTKVDYTVVKDECNRPSTDMASLQKLGPVRGEIDYADVALP